MTSGNPTGDEFDTQIAEVKRGPGRPAGSKNVAKPSQPSADLIMLEVIVPDTSDGQTTHFKGAVFEASAEVAKILEDAKHVRRV